MRDIINDNSILLTVINRFSISLGFGDKSVAVVCEENDVDVDTFLAVINLISGKDWSGYRIALSSLIGYLRKSHQYILNHALPTIKKTLIEGIQQTNTSEIAMFILKFYDGYMQEVRKHMEYEDNVVFSYVENLIAGKAGTNFRFPTSHPATSTWLAVWTILRNFSSIDTTSRTTNLSASPFSISSCAATT